MPKDAQIAIGVSGGADSMSLAKILSKSHNITALTVDHGIRSESAAEAVQVQKWLSPHMDAHILKTDEPPPKTKIQEWARDLRYRLMTDYCKVHDIKYLAIAHHMDDQAETLLFRLAKGSGIKGLSCMKSKGEINGITILRPLLNTPKSEILNYCALWNIKFIDDPSNKNEKFARVRLRKALEGEGMTPSRLAKTAARLARADDALEKIANEQWLKRARATNGKIEIDIKGLHEELVLRLLQKAVDVLSPSKYGARMSKLETIASLCHAPFPRRTLAGVVFSCDSRNLIMLTKEG